MGKDLDPQDAYVTNPDSAPTGFSLLQLTRELLHGAVTKWMNDDGTWAANVILAFRLKYTGTDAVTAALFASDPANPNTRVEYVKVMGTNADTMTYKQLTSLTPSEPVPVGYAQLLYETLSVLHWQGDLEITEQECTGRLPMGCIFNVTDGLAAWASMKALVLSVDENIDRGITKVKFGPTMHLGLQDLVELARANRGRVFPYNLDQRTTGQTGNDNAIIGHTRVPAHATFSAPGGSPPKDTQPYAPTDASVGAAPRVAISDGIFGGQPTTGSPVTVGGGAGTIYIQTDYTYDASNNKTIVDSQFKSTSGAVPPSTISPSGSSGGSGSVNWPCCSYNAVVVNGKATTSPSRLIGGSQNFGVCQGALSGPWGV